MHFFIRIIGVQLSIKEKLYRKVAMLRGRERRLHALESDTSGLP